MSNNTVFKKITIESFGGISPDSPITIVFPDETREVLLEGNQGTNKTSSLLAIESLLGNTFSDFYVNSKSKSIKGETEFEVDGHKYRTRMTKTTFKFEELLNVAGKEKWISPGEDKTLIRKLLPYATDPSILMQKDGTEQLNWIKQIAGSNADDTELQKSYKCEYDKRTILNRDITNYQRQLVESTGYVKEGGDLIPTEDFQKLQEAVNVDLSEVISIEEAEVRNLRESETTFIKAKAKFENFDIQIKDKNKEIENLLKQIEDKKTEIEKIEESKIIGAKYLDENKNIPEKIKVSEDKLNATLAVQRETNRVALTNKTYEAYKAVFDEAIKLTTKIDEIKEKRLEIAKSLTPDIADMEIILGEIIDGVERKGIYYKGINIASMSESERYALCIQIWQYYGIKVVFIENISSLGSHAMEVIQNFINSGGNVFATAMKRNQNTISVSFSINEILPNKYE